MSGTLRLVDDAECMADARVAIHDAGISLSVETKDATGQRHCPCDKIVCRGTFDNSALPGSELWTDNCATNDVHAAYGWDYQDDVPEFQRLNSQQFSCSLSDEEV